MKSANQKVRAVVVGVGSIGQHHARVFNELADAELVGVADLDASTAQAVAGRFGVPWYTDTARLFRDTQPEVVSVAVPAGAHESVTLAALDAGANVLVEKPIATTLVAGQRMVARAHEAGRILMVGHIVRFNPAIQALKERLQDGFLGRIYQIICRRVGPFPTRVNDLGVVVDLAPHDLDLMRYLTGLEPIRAYAEITAQAHTAYDDLLNGLLRFADGTLGSLEVNWLNPIKRREVFVLGERGLFRVDDLTQDLYFYEHAGMDVNVWPALQTLRGSSEGGMVRFSLQRIEPLQAELQAFLDAVRGKTPPPVTGEDGLAALRLALALLESARTHQVVQC